MLKQLNINCPKCRRFVKILGSKKISELKSRFISECKHCQIKTLASIDGNITKSGNKQVYEGMIKSVVNEEIKEETFNRYLKQFQETKKRLKPEEKKEQIFNYLAKKNMAVKKPKIAKDLGFSLSSVNKLCSQLKKEKKIVYMISGKRFKKFKSTNTKAWSVYVVPKLERG